MKVSILATAVASLLSTGALAEIQVPDEVETIVVTANRYEQGVNDLISPIEVITKEDIQDLHAESITDVLKRLPGIQVANQGGTGQGASIFVRGRSSRNVLVMINGIRIGSATTGMANLSALPIQSVERIEVLRGPRASVYGSDAVSGVINLITSTEGKNETSVTGGIGSDGRYDTSTSLATSTDKSWFGISGAYEEADGYNVLPDSTNPIDADDDGYKNKYLVVDGGYAVTDSLTIKGTAFYQAHENDFDSPWVGNDMNESDAYNIGLIVDYKADQLASSLTLAQNQDISKAFGQGVPGSDIQTDRTSVSWLNQYEITSDANLMGGVDWYKEEVDNSTTDLTDDSRSNSAVYVGANYHHDKYMAEMNVRLDDSSAFGTFTTYQLGAAYDFTETLRLVGMYGTSFKSPTFNDLYWPRYCSWWGCYEGNPNLEPEETTSGEVAIESSFELFDLRVGYHESKVEKLIASSGDTSVNVGEAEIKGVEVVASFDTYGLYHEVSYDYLDATNEDTGKELVRRAKNSGKWNVSYLADDWKLNVSYLYQGKRYSDAANTKELDSYSLTDVALTYYVTDSLLCGGKVGNLFNKEFETVSGYKTPERNYHASVNYTF